MINPPEMHRASRKLSREELSELEGLLRMRHETGCGQFRVGMCLDVCFSPEVGQSIQRMSEEISTHVVTRFSEHGKAKARFHMMSFADIGPFMLASNRDAYMVRFREVL